MSETPTIIDAAPVLLVRDIRRAVDFYTKKLWFQVDDLHGEPPSFAMANAGATTIMLKESADGPRPNAVEEMWDVYLWVGDIDAVETALSAAGVPIVRGPSKTPYGCAEIEIDDPDGHRIAFGFCP